jgi:hypothetical protein
VATPRARVGPGGWCAASVPTASPSGGDGWCYSLFNSSRYLPLLDLPHVLADRVVLQRSSAGGEPVGPHTPARGAPLENDSQGRSAHALGGRRRLAPGCRGFARRYLPCPATRPVAPPQSVSQCHLLGDLLRQLKEPILGLVQHSGLRQSRQLERLSRPPTPSCFLAERLACIPFGDAEIENSKTAQRSSVKADRLDELARDLGLPEDYGVTRKRTGTPRRHRIPVSSGHFRQRTGTVSSQFTGA